jgi:integrase
MLLLGAPCQDCAAVLTNLHEFRENQAASGSLQAYMGHSSVTITYDRYGHLMPGNEDEAASLADAYLEQRAAQLRHSEAQ